MGPVECSFLREKIDDWREGCCGRELNWKGKATIPLRDTINQKVTIPWRERSSIRYAGKYSPFFTGALNSFQHNNKLVGARSTSSRCKSLNRMRRHWSHWIQHAVPPTGTTKCSSPQDLGRFVNQYAWRGAWLTLIRCKQNFESDFWNSSPVPLNLMWCRETE